MRFHYDLCQAEPIIRDYVVAGSSDIENGAVVALEGAITTDDNRFGLQNVNGATLDNVVGVSNEMYDVSASYSGLDQPDGPLGTGTVAQTEPSTGVSNYMKVIINPMAVWLAEYSQNAADDTTNTSASADGKDITATFTTGREGDWIYVTDTGSSTGGAGNIAKIGVSNSTTSVTMCTSYDDNLNAVTTSDTFVVITNPYTALAAGGSLDLSAVSGQAGTMLKGVAATGAGAAIVLQSYISDKSTPMEPLKVERHSGRVMDAASTHIYSDIQLSDHLLLGATVSNRIIT